jgi:hypothetical protein
MVSPPRKDVNESVWFYSILLIDIQRKREGVEGNRMVPFKKLILNGK